MKEVTSRITDCVARAARPRAARHEDIVDRIGDARFVLIGGTSHGTREFYEVRAEITRRLIEDKGFRIIAIEAD